MLVKRKKIAGEKLSRGCLACGTTDNLGKRRYCSIHCRGQLRQKLNARIGLLQALNTRYATFYFNDDEIVMDVVVHGIREIFRFVSPRQTGRKPADDFGGMANLLGAAWWAEEKKTGKTYLASRHVLDLAQRHAMTEGLTRPRLIRVPTVNLQNLAHLDLTKTDLHVPDLVKTVKNAYRRQVKIHHPDAGGQAATFRKIHDAYKELLRWADHPTFIRRRGFPDKWYYDGDNKRWVQPMPAKR